MSFQSAKLIIETDANGLRSNFKRISTAFLTKSVHFFEDVCLSSFFPRFRIRTCASFSSAYWQLSGASYWGFRLRPLIDKKAVVKAKTAAVAVVTQNKLAALLLCASTSST